MAADVHACKALWLLCHSHLSPTRSGQKATIRLQDGPAARAGRVELLYDGFWGTLCENKWDLRIGDVICRQLGYPAALAVPCCQTFGRGIGPRLLDGIRCVGNETSVADCAHGPWRVRSCAYNPDASVVCRAESVAANSKSQSSHANRANQSIV